MERGEAARREERSSVLCWGGVGGAGVELQRRGWKGRQARKGSSGASVCGQGGGNGMESKGGDA